MMGGVLLVLYSLASCALATRGGGLLTCRIVDLYCGGDTLPSVPEGTSGSQTAHYPLDPNAFIQCDVANTSRCEQTIDNNLLIGRSWYITQDKAYFARGYNPLFFQTFNIQCPMGHYLNIGFQRPTMFVCAGMRISDSIRIFSSRGGLRPFCASSSVTVPSYLDRPGGIILENPSAMIDFCTDEDGMADGFMIRGSCINPELTYDQTSCVSFPFFQRWDPLFVNKIEEAFDMEVTTTETPHKRSAEEGLFDYLEEKVKEIQKLGEEQERIVKKAFEESIDGERVKRGARYIFDFPARTEVVFNNFMLTFTFRNGTVRSFTVYHLTASNELYGTRRYYQNATRQVGDATGDTLITFTGPGSVDIFPNGARNSINGLLRWTPSMPFEDFLENSGIQQQIIAGRIYDYIAEQWVAPYVVVDDFLAEGLDPKPYPSSARPGGSFFPPNVRTRDNIRVLFPTISDDSICKPVVRFADAPLKSSRIDPDLVSFCSFFQRACDPILATACRELMLLDPFQQDPSSMAMMGGGD